MAAAAAAERRRQQSGGGKAAVATAVAAAETECLRCPVRRDGDTEPPSRVCLAASPHSCWSCSGCPRRWPLLRRHHRQRRHHPHRCLWPHRPLLRPFASTTGGGGPSVQASEPRGLVNDIVAGSLADAEAAASSDALPVSGTIEQTSVLKYGLEVREFECAPAVETWTTRHIGAACILLSAHAGEDDVRVRF